MAWHTPITWTTNQVVTSSQLNAQIKDNMNQTAPAKATGSGKIFAANGVNSIAERTPETDYIDASETTTSTSYTNLATVGPALSVASGTQALVIMTAGMWNNTPDAESFMGITLSGDTTESANDTAAMRHTSSTNGSQHAGSWAYIYPLTQGTTGYTAKYKCSSGTSRFFDRRISVVPF